MTEKNIDHPFYPGYFERNCLDLAQDLVGKVLIRTLPDGTELSLRITETEAYGGTTDTACHAHRGKTQRNSLLWSRGGTVYVYLCYGIHWMLNIISGPEEDPQGVLIRACEKPYDGPGKLTKALSIDKSINGSDILSCPGLRLEDDGFRCQIECLPRVGIDYASPEDRARPWRFKAIYNANKN